jgi:hypothetical protein
MPSEARTASAAARPQETLSLGLLSSACGSRVRVSRSVLICFSLASQARASNAACARGAL